MLRDDVVAIAPFHSHAPRTTRADRRPGGRRHLDCTTATQSPGATHRALTCDLGGRLEARRLAGTPPSAAYAAHPGKTTMIQKPRHLAGIVTILAALTCATALSASAQVSCHIEWAPLRDGVTLATEVYLPSNLSGRLPVILQRTPYNRFPQVRGATATVPTSSTSPRTGTWR